MYQVIDGRAHALCHEQALKRKLANLNIKPVLVSILVGDDPSSVLYTSIKQKKAYDLGIDFRVEKFEPQPFRLQAIFDKIAKLNKDSQVNGIMIQLPIPREFLGNHSSEKLISLIDPKKDVDGLRQDSPYLAATVKGVISLLKDEDINLTSKIVCVVGAKGEVGKRLVKALEGKAKEVIKVDKATQDPQDLSKKADILISSTGQAELIKKDWVKVGAVVIDVGSEKLEDGKVIGDVDFDEVAPITLKITPVPGGVGPMTVISLMENVVESVYGNDG